MLRIGIISAPPHSSREKSSRKALLLMFMARTLKLLHGRGSGRNAMKKINV
jgi:hypothetical protein